MIQRRDFITLLGGAGVWPVAARAQQSGGMRRVGLLSADGENSPITQARVGALQNGLEALGWIEGRNLQINIRGGSSEPDRLRIIAAQMVRLSPDVILSEPSGLKLLQEATRQIPIVFVLVLDPVRDGYVASVAKPGGNLTGFASYDPAISGKYLQLLKEIAQNVTRELLSTTRPTSE
jgi:putative tryptophan/tyrosine transport system substrate-binding protein